MKTLLYLAPLLLLTLNLFAQLDRDALEKARIRENHVSECTQYTHKYDKKKPSQNGYKTSVTKYDRNGNPTEITNFRANGEISSKHYYTYNPQGLRVEYRKEEKSGGDQMKIFFKQVFTYDAKGNKKTETGFDGSSNYKVIYNYLPNGKLADVTRYNADNSVAERWIYSYDGDKQIIRVTPKSGKPYNVEKIYDGKGNLLDDCQFAPDGTEKRRVKFTYQQGRIHTESEIIAGKAKHVLTYVFNASGQLVRVMQTQPDGNEVVNNDYTYDKSGNLITEKWLDGAPNLVSKKDSEFDTKGNMVKVDSYYAPYKYRVVYTYEYKHF